MLEREVAEGEAVAVGEVLERPVLERPVLEREVAEGEAVAEEEVLERNVPYGEKP